MTEFSREANSACFISGPAGRLEALTAWPREGEAKAVAIICHPNPQEQGTMHNKVVTTLAKAFTDLGLATVRFNYRGVGKSEGEYADTIGEREDLRAVLAWVQAQLPGLAFWLAGFSFGAYISAAIAGEVSPAQLVSIAPPVNRRDFGGFSDIRCPWMVVQGDQDEVVPVGAVNAFVSASAVDIDYHVMSGVGHFFHGNLIELRELLKNKL